MTVSGNQKYVSRYGIRWKIFEQIGIRMILTFFLITMLEINTAAEVYLEPFQIYMIKLLLRK